MLPVVAERYDTLTVPRERRGRYWGEIVAKTTTPAAFETPEAGDLRCSLTRGVFERFTVSHVDTSEFSMFRGKEHMASTTGVSYLFMQLEGEGELVSKGRSIKTTAGSLILFDETTPYRFKALSPLRNMAIGVPSSLIATRLPAHRDIEMRPLDGSCGVNQVLQASMRSIDTLFVEQDVRNFPRALFMSLVELLAASTEDVRSCDANVTTMTRWAGKIRAYVEANLDDPDLTPAAIAAAFGISPRYLRLIFAESNEILCGDETLRRYILRRRLEQCAIRLAEPASSVGSITLLAHSWGFSDSSYFARRFCEHFGMTPRVYRSAMQRKQADAAIAADVGHSHTAS